VKSAHIEWKRAFAIANADIEDDKPAGLDIGRELLRRALRKDRVRLHGDHAKTLAR
jgi:hypothetical protein